MSTLMTARAGTSCASVVGRSTYAEDFTTAPAGNVMCGQRGLPLVISFSLILRSAESRVSLLLPRTTRQGCCEPAVHAFLPATTRPTISSTDAHAMSDDIRCFMVVDLQSGDVCPVPAIHPRACREPDATAAAASAPLICCCRCCCCCCQPLLVPLLLLLLLPMVMALVLQLQRPSPTTGWAVTD